MLFNLERYAALGVAGISIGSNDLTQLLLGADRDSELLAETFDERDPAVADYLRAADPARPRARACRPRSAARRRRSIRSTRTCSSRAGIDAISVNMDVVDRTRRLVAAAEQRVLLEAARDGSCELRSQVRFHGRGGQGVVTAAELLVGRRVRRGPPRAGVPELRLRAHGRAGRGVLPHRRPADPHAASRSPSPTR